MELLCLHAVNMCTRGLGFESMVVFFFFVSFVRYFELSETYVVAKINDLHTYDNNNNNNITHDKHQCVISCRENVEARDHSIPLCKSYGNILYKKKKSPSELQNNYLGTFIIVCQNSCFFFFLNY